MGTRIDLRDNSICWLLLLCGLFLGPLPCRAGYLFWTDRDTDSIQRSDLKGNGAISIAPIPNENHTLAIDPAAQKLYWVASTSGTINRSNFDGSNVETVIASGLNLARELVVNSANGHLFWVEQSSGTIRRSDLNGSNITTIVSGADNPYGLALDSIAGKLYWTVGTTLGGSSDAVWRADLDGQNAGQFQLTGSDAVHGIEVDTAAGDIYWGIAYPGPVGEIQHMKTDATGFATLLTGPSSSDFRHLALDEVNHTIYFDDLGSKTIRRIDYNGGNLLTVVSSGDPHSVAVYVPEPSSLTLLAVGGWLVVRKTRYSGLQQ